MPALSFCLLLIIKLLIIIGISVWAETRIIPTVSAGISRITAVIIIEVIIIVVVIIVVVKVIKIIQNLSS